MQGTSTATSSYPVPEVPVHRNQLGDLSLLHDKPLLTVSSTFKATEDYKDFLKGRESNQHLRNEFAKEHCGLKGYINRTGLDSTDVYPPCMHRVFNCLSSICIRGTSICNARETEIKMA